MSPLFAFAFSALLNFSTSATDLVYPKHEVVNFEMSSITPAPLYLDDCCTCDPCNVYTATCHCGTPVTFQWCEDCYHGSFGSYLIGICGGVCNEQ